MITFIRRWFFCSLAITIVANESTIHDIGPHPSQLESMQAIKSALYFWIESDLLLDFGAKDQILQQG